MTTADQDWKTGPLNRSKYVIRKTCKECDGDGGIVCTCGARGIDDCTCQFFRDCPKCDGNGSVPVDPAAAYFVLRIDGNHDPNARAALAYYADMITDDNPEFAWGVWAWLKETAVAAD